MPSRLDRVIAVIDELIDDELARGESCGDVGQTECVLCGGDWHGATADADSAFAHGRTAGCPGAFGNEDETRRWLRDTAADAAPVEAGCDCGWCLDSVAGRVDDCDDDEPPWQKRPICVLPLW